MRSLVIWRFAVRNLLRTIGRSSVTLLGIVIGVSAVIALLGIGNGAKARVEASMRHMDANQVILGAKMPASPGQQGARLPPPGKGLTFDDYYEIKRAFSSYATVNVDVSAGGGVAAVRGNGRATPASVSGIDAMSRSTTQFTLHRGSFFTAVHIEAAASVCIITQAIAKNLFGSKDPLDQLVLIQDMPFRVIGVVENSSASSGVNLADDTRVLLPYTSVVRRINRYAAQYMTITVRPGDASQLTAVQQRLSDIMESRRGGRTCEFVTGNLAQIARSFQQNSQTLTLLLAAIASISLVVGGIGVMNLMLVNVKERTREIGIFFAVGTRESDVAKQFLAEAVILCVMGGAVGIALGIACAKVIGNLGQLEIDITLASIVGAVLCSGTIGAFFGWYPAQLAARLDPIVALRAE